MEDGYWAAVGYMNLAADFARDDLDSSRALVSLRVAMAMAAKDADANRNRALLDQLNLRAGYLALGSDDYDVQPLPVLNLTYGDDVSINLRDGIAWHALRQGDWTVSPYIGYTFGRDNEGDISRFEKVDGGATLGLRVSYQQGMWRYSIAGSTAGDETNSVEAASFTSPPFDTHLPKSDMVVRLFSLARSPVTAIAQVLLAGAESSHVISFCLSSSAARSCAFVASFQMSLSASLKK